MLSPKIRKTMNERVITGNPSFMSTRGPSPTKFGDGPPSLCRGFPKSCMHIPVRPKPRINKKHSVQTETAWLLPIHLIHEVSAQETKQLRVIPPHGVSTSPSRLSPSFKRASCHGPPSAFERATSKQSSKNLTFSYYHEINPLRLAHPKSSNAQPSSRKNGSSGPRTTRRSLLSRSSRLLMQHPIQGFGK